MKRRKINLHTTEYRPSGPMIVAMLILAVFVFGSILLLAWLGGWL